MKVKIEDPFGAVRDPNLPGLAAALDPVEARKELKRGLPRLTGTDGKLRLEAIRVIRHKPRRRCLAEYDVCLERPGSCGGWFTIIGKTRARRFGKQGFRQLERVWDTGFDVESEDGISVPEPLGVIPRFRMWFQRKAPGRPAQELLADAGAAALMERIAEAIHKVHRANVPAERKHEIGDELRILNECLAKVRRQEPAWAERLEQVEAACERLGASLPGPRFCGIHRDFYPAQVLVSDSRLHLIDFDLYCLGDPALDVGNFVGHVAEQAIREHGDPAALMSAEAALINRFVQLEGEQCRPAVEAYKTLTLVRHIYLSTQFPERREFTPALLRLCEQRLGLG